MSRWAFASILEIWLIYLKKARAMLDEAGFPNATITASSDLDEEVIFDLRAQGAKIDTWGVGTRLITSQNAPSLGGVYKLSALEKNGEMIPKIKLSENKGKITNPGYKKVLRIYDKAKHKALADLICLDEEQYDETKPLTIFDPVDTWKKLRLTNYTLRGIAGACFCEGQTGVSFSLPAGYLCLCKARNANAVGRIQTLDKAASI